MAKKRKKAKAIPKSAQHLISGFEKFLEHILTLVIFTVSHQKRFFLHRCFSELS
jgi:cell division protein FtsL